MARGEASSDGRWRRLALLLAAGLPALFVVYGAILLFISGSLAYAGIGAAALTGALALNLFLVARSTWAARLTRAGRLWVVVLCWALQPALMTGVLLGAFGAEWQWALAAAVLVGLVAAPIYARQRPKATEMQVLQPLAVDSLKDGRLLDDATRAQSDAPKAPATVRALNRARAVMMLALREDDSDRVQEALPLLRAALTDPALDPVIALSAADDLVNAESSMAERSRDDRRYAQAIALLTEVVKENPRVPNGRAKLHGHRACHLAFQLRRMHETWIQASKAGDTAGEVAAERALRELCQGVKRERLAAIAYTKPGTPIWAQELAMHGQFLCRAAELGEEKDLMEGVGLIRRALDRRVGLPAELRHPVELQLASALQARAPYMEDGLRDLDESRTILNRLVRLGPPIEAGARALLLENAVIRAEIE
ncbi:hypothetical protein ACTMTI_24445 [Nonomuraea sp. H19]|uniref:hypothetical protein n=1 Tax=Nonomuraea sp. H19 TaxID=3452206 RepID=UPI003F8897FA